MERADYPGLKQRIHFDNSSIFPLHQKVIEAINQAMLIVASPGKAGYDGVAEANQIVQKTKLQLAEFLSTKPENLQFVYSSTDGINKIARYLASQTHGRVVYSREDHASLVKAIDRNFSDSETFRLQYSQTGVYQNFEIKPGDLIFGSLVHHLYGAKNDLLKLTTQNATTVLDLSQAVGRTMINLDNSGVDFAFFSGQKIGALPGIGVVYMRCPGPDFEPNSLQLAAIASLSAALHVFTEISPIQRIYQLMNLSDHLLSELEKIPAVHFSKGVGLSSVACDGTGIVSFRVDGYASSDIAMLADEAGFNIRSGDHCVDPQFVDQDLNRVSFAPYNTFEEVDQFVDFLRSLA